MMNARHILLVGLGAATLVLQSPAQDKKPEDQKPEEKKPEVQGFDRDAFIRKYDKNGDGKLDDKERLAARKERQEELIKQYDKNGDGKLDNKERQAAREEFQKSRERPAGKEGPDKKKTEETPPKEPNKSAPPAV
jgi:Ca2+-binding EF-hand superfamily protein